MFFLVRFALCGLTWRCTFEQVLGEEEQVALDEFEKFEARLKAKEM